ncbi:MAG: 2-oxoacid:acceptor oxidoreductase subunit alpha [Pseudomonadota bacterium]
MSNGVNQEKSGSLPTAPGKGKTAPKERTIVELDSVTIRFAGDSGDGMQLTGTQFTTTTAMFGNDLATFPDYPSEIRAPAGSIPGVSGFQINFSSHDVRTPGDTPNVLVAMNPAALKVHLKDIPLGEYLVINTDAFNDVNLKKAGYTKNPLTDGSLSGYRRFEVPITTLNSEALKDLPLTKKEKDRSKNFFALGFMYWLFDRPVEPTIEWIKEKFGKAAAVAEANIRAVKAGYYFGDTSEAFTTLFRVPPAQLAKGLYRQVTGNQATALGLVAAAHLAKRPLFYASYPITPASEILQELSELKNYDVRTFQAEDEIAAIGIAIGASFGGNLGVTGTSGPGLALKSEAIGLAVMAELPVVIVDVQRAGPSTGMPTKTEQADLFQALFGRASESPAAVVAAASPSECFQFAIEASRIATKFMCPVLLMSDGYLGNGAEPWRIPELSELPKFEIMGFTDAGKFHPYLRDEKTLSRPWIVPGTKGFEHRIGGLEKQDVVGAVSHDPLNHEKMVRLRAEKIQRIADDIPEAKVFGKPGGKVLVVGWGGTYGAITTAVEQLQKEGKPVSSLHLRYLNPLQKNVGEILNRFDRVLVPELNLGQLLWLLRSRFLVDAVGLNKIQGQPFKINEIKEGIEKLL